MGFESIKTPAHILEQDSAAQPELERTVRVLIAKAAKKLLAQVPGGQDNPKTVFNISVAGAGQLVRQVLDKPADSFVEFKDTMPMMERIVGSVSPAVASAPRDPSAEIPNDLCRISFELEEANEIATVALRRVQPFPVDIQTQENCRVLDMLAGHNADYYWYGCKLTPGSREFPRTYQPHPRAPEAGWRFFSAHAGYEPSRYRRIILEPLMGDAAYPLVRVPGLGRSNTPDIRDIVSMVRTRLARADQDREERRARERMLKVGLFSDRFTSFGVESE